jgi:hypothetical protein
MALGDDMIRLVRHFTLLAADDGAAYPRTGKAARISGPDCVQ